MCFLMHRLICFWDKSLLSKKIPIIKHFINKALKDSNIKVKKNARL